MRERSEGANSRSIFVRELTIRHYFHVRGRSEGANSRSKRANPRSESVNFRS